MEVYEFVGEAMEGGVAKQKTRPVSAQPHVPYTQRPRKHAVGDTKKQKRPKSSGPGAKRWSPSSQHSNDRRGKWRGSQGDPHTRLVSPYTISTSAINQQFSNRPEERSESPLNDANALPEADLVQSFWPGARVSENSVLPTVSIDNIKMERKMSNFLANLENDMGDESTLKALHFLKHSHGECCELMYRDLRRVYEQTVSVEVAQQSMYCVGHINLICQAWEALFQYSEHHASKIRNVRVSLDKQIESLATESTARIAALEDQVKMLKPPELSKEDETKNKSATADEGVVGRYTLAARQRNREVNYSSASRQLQDLYTTMMDGKLTEKTKARKSKLKKRVKTVGGSISSGGAPDMDALMKNRNSGDRASMLEQVYRTFNTVEKVEVVASILSEMNEAERKHLNADYISDLPEHEKIEILRAMTKGVDVDERSMMIENLLEGLTIDERSAMIVEELDTLPDGQLNDLVATLINESLRGDARKNVVKNVILEMSQVEKEETVSEMIAQAANPAARHRLFLSLVAAMPENERDKIMNGMGKKETKDMGTDPFNMPTLKSGKKKSKKSKKGDASLHNLPASVRGYHWSKYLVERPAHVKHRAITVGRAEKLIGHIYKKKIKGDIVDDRDGSSRLSMCECVFHYFNQKYGMKKMAEEFIYGMVHIADKSRDQHKRVHTFGVLLGKINTDSYSPTITDVVLGFLSNIYPVEKIGTSMDEGDTKCYALLSTCINSVRKILVPEGNVAEQLSIEDKEAKLGRDRFYIPIKSFQQIEAKFNEWATPANKVKAKSTAKLGSQSVIDVDDAMHFVMTVYLEFNDKSRQELVSAIQAFDEDGDGKISFHEFKTFLGKCHSPYVPITERLISKLWMEMQEILDKMEIDAASPQLAAEVFASASMHYDIHPPPKDQIDALVKEKGTMVGEADSDVDDTFENE
jgi:Ca2+-binding EF-hand superfamily protein